MNMCDFNLSHAQLTLIMKLHMLDDGVHPWNKFETSVNGGETKAIDSINLSLFSSVKYIITVYNKDEQKIITKEITVNKVSDTKLKDIVFGKVGHDINHTITPTIVGSEMNLVFSNLESFSVDVRIARLISE